MCFSDTKERQMNRNKTMDIIKAILILSVTVYHLVYGAQNFDIVTQEMIYLSIPLFFMLSGYFYKKRGEGIVRPLGNRLKKLLLWPAITTTVVLILLCPYYMTVHSYTFKDWLSDFLTTFIRPELMGKILPDYLSSGCLYKNMSTVWFIWALVWASILFYIVIPFVRDSMPKTVAAALILLTGGGVLYIFLPPLSWSLGVVPLYTGIMFLGFILSRFDIDAKLKEVNIVLSVVIAVAAAVVHYIIFGAFGSDQLYRSFFGGHDPISVLLFVLQILIGFYFLHVIARLLEKTGPFGMALSWIGRHTLVSLIFHGVIGGLVSDLIGTYDKMGADWYVDPLTPYIVIKSVIVCITAVAGCSGLSLINDRLKQKYKLKQ